ncbi:hypothetical protein [Aliarcobacter butzleri]|uniref:hypothetical protein n=1 Tax=Aliarcobacter butzleri TaxID=28197 RepID=UPI001EDC82F3|nr:hypothetical protein [Aliarcobacter butzleri]MCG3671929.1 hypothetical protein [Aliarcobacter butzleri]
MSLVWFKFYFIMIGTVLFSMFLFSLRQWKANLIIENNKLILKTVDRNKIEKIIFKLFKMKNKQEEIYFKDIHSFLKEKDLLGYQFFIYTKDKIEPKFGFAFFSIHEAIAIEELLKHEIDEAIKKEKSKEENQIN